MIEVLLLSGSGIVMGWIGRTLWDMRPERKDAAWRAAHPKGMENDAPDLGTEK